MARNRRKGSASIRLVPALKALILCTLLGASSVGYVLQKNKIHKLGRQIREREVQLDRLRNANHVLKSQNAELLSPPRLEERLRHFGLHLDLPQPNQQVWLRRPTLNNNNNNTMPLENLVWGGGSTSEAIK